MGHGIRQAWVALAIAAGLAACMGGERPDYPVRSAPPEVRLAVEPPGYSASAQVPLSISAKNPTGVKAVYALAGSQRYAAAPHVDGTWKVTVQLPVVGTNPVTIWAEDAAAPTPNSGQGMDAPFQLVKDIMYDPTPPSVSYDAAFASYSDERKLALRVDENGIAKVPAAYVEGEKRPVPPGGDFYKAWSRLGAGAEMNAAELETTNDNNIPVLRFVVAYNPNTDSPILTPTFVAHVSCPPPCPQYPDAEGELLRSPTADGQHVYFDLPLATETIPALASLLGPATVSIDVTASDAAGNTATVPGFEFTFHTIGPPLAIAEDTEYPAAGEADSTYPYRLADNSYGGLWEPLSQFPTYNVRLLRYIVTNAAPAAVAIQLDYAQDERGSWQAVESWSRFSAHEPIGRDEHGDIYLNVPSSSVAFTVDGFTFHNALYWGLPYGTTAGDLPQAEYGPHPCGGPGQLLHRIGDRTNKYLCYTRDVVDMFSTTPEVGVFSQADVSLFVYRVAPELKGQERDAAKDPSGHWFLVPPAVGGVPGALVVYLARPVTAPRTRALEWNAVTSSPASGEAVNHYQKWDYEFWWGYRQPMSGLYPGFDTYVAYRLGVFLAAAEEHLYGALSGTTRAYSGTALVGEPAARFTTTISREPLAVH